MEKLTRKLAANVARSLDYDAEREAVIAYGLIGLVQIIITFALVLLFGSLVGAPAEALIVCAAVGLLRKYSGGAHAGSAELCNAISVVYSTSAAVAAKRYFSTADNLALQLLLTAVIFGVSYLIVYRFAPVDSPNKPIKTVKKKKRMRQGSFIILTVYFLLAIALFLAGCDDGVYASYGISLLFGVIWQIFTLTSPGAFLLHSLDLRLQKKEVNKL
ncbi:MAG: accessory gene regulator B family protein [Negativicutes bacterium]|nr:accessory gene regulator B family protein [Negativicutes bacterium]